jgi:Zn-finger nucleic acid-binding protein
MAQERVCPKCPFTLLDAKSVRGVSIDECKNCGGRWYDLGELVRSVERPEKLRDLMSKGPLKPKPGDAPCPACKKDMVNGGIVNPLLRADMCPDCRGFWLDKNEFGLIDRLLAAL